ncbi:iron complex outermembrane receptor protein [Roseivirga pacifica]|uniref:Iron complex outermembrane recepter protein n=1 Tax=Roseivirga pacifica TaxID=1267423 RepID=A0A1I0QCF7_9BACT|nr:TonB-dependent receptor [Roseivirga pacifica]RKQ43057.1 iron complex outermembrane receptor protein [Roseivirga pacifica]SEW24562.1 iron complex outermembrane recepter protein [Roseivirga pacifica]
MNSTIKKQFTKLSIRTLCCVAIMVLINPYWAMAASWQKLENYSVDLSLREASIVDVIKEIEVQTTFKFVYDRKVSKLDNSFSIKNEDISLRTVLELMAKEANLSFKRISNTISVGLEEQAAEPVVEIKTTAITGTVLDQDGVTLPGASVREKGTANGAITDADGKFNLDVSDDAVLVVSYIGYVTQEVAVNGQTQLTINMQLDSNQLDDVVVVGYGIQKRADVTGSISSVKEGEFNQGVVSNPGQLLQGKVAGVNVSMVSGEPGASQNVIIRGIGSLRSGTTPLYVVDGFVLDNSQTGVASNPLNFINPNDIASIDVLKDASAAAIYGARGANGVIVITTKKGTSSQGNQINLDVSTAISNMSKKIDVFSADEFRQQVVNEGGTLYDAGGNTDWQDELTRTAISNKINLSMSGANQGLFSYYGSVGVDDQEGILDDSDLKIYSTRLNLNQKAIDGRLNVDLNINGTRTENHRPDANAMVVDMLQLNPTLPIYANGEPTRIDDMLNPVVRNQLYTDEAINNRIIAKISPSIEILEGLTYKLDLGVDYSATDRDIQWMPYALLEGYENGTLTTVTTANQNTLVENTLTYKFGVDKHDFTVLAGHSYQKTLLTQKSISMEGFADNGVEPRYQDQISSAEFPTTLSSFAVRNELQSFLARVQYSYGDKYLATVTMRADGSSKFGENNKYGYFPSVALGWNIIKEDFMATTSLNNLKLRMSWGQTGNQEIPSKITQSSYTDSKSENDTYPLDPDATTLDGYPYGTIYTRLANPDIQWEVSTQTNIGLDFGFMENKLTGTLDVFRKVSENILLEVVPADPIQPTATYWTNIPEMEIRNTGVELTLDYAAEISNDFSFNIGGNVSSIKNEVANSPYAVLTTGAAQGAGQTGATINGYINGEPIGAFYMKEFIGIGADGLNEFRDINGDGEILDDDRSVVGSALPKMLYGFHLNFRYKNFDLGTNFNGVSGNKIFNHTALSIFNKGRLTSSFNTTDFATEYPNESITNSNEVSTRYLEDGSFLRLNNATLGYNFKLNESGALSWIRNVRFTVTGQNLFVITNYTGHNPEVNTGSSLGGVQTFGVDRFTYPTPRTVVFGLNVTF